MNRPLEITTTTHALAVSIYLLQAIQGILYVIGLANASSMTDLIGEPAVGLWSIILAAGGVLATVAVVMARKPTYTLPALRTEMWAATALAIASFWYEATLIIGNGLSEVVTTQSYAVMVGAGCIARMVQIRRERRRVIRTLHHPTVTNVVADVEGK